MDRVCADVELINGQDDAKRTHVKMLVDNSSVLLAINENIQGQLQLPVVEKRRVQLGNGQILECEVAGPVEIRFKNVRNWCSAIVLPGDSEPLIKSILIDEEPARLPYWKFL
jgi:hypothetical protein